MDKIEQYKRNFPSYANYYHTFSGKRDFISKQFEIKGIALANLMQYKDALEAFNKSLCYSPLEANRGALYAYRAQVYVNSNMYNAALKNVELAERFGATRKMWDLKKLCVTKSRYTCFTLTTHLHNEIMQLSYECNAMFPSIVKYVKVESDLKYGRHIIATRPLETGDIIAIEDPYWQSMISKEHHNEDAEHECCYQRCYHCFKNNSMNLIPCDTCEIAMFCSTDCKINAICEYHGIECMLPKHVKEASGVLRTFRPLFIALSLFDGDFNDLEAFLADAKKDSTVFDFDLSSPRSVLYRKNMLLASWALKPSFRATSDEKYRLLQEHPVFRDVWDTKKYFIKQFLQHHDQIFQGNYVLVKRWPMDVATIISKHRVFTTDLTSPMMYKKAVGFGCFPFTSLLNHSCAPNCFSLINKAGKMVTVVVRAIPRGGQLFINYDGQSVNYFAKSPFETRQLTLYQRHGFKCECLACIKHTLFPTYYINWKNSAKNAETLRTLSKELMNIGPINTTIKFRQECLAMSSCFNQSPQTEQMCLATETLIHYFALICYPFFKFPDY